MDFDWVKHRAKCTAASMFEQLKGAVQKDVETRDALDAAKGELDFSYTRKERPGFSFSANGDSFYAQAQSSRGRHVVLFVLLDDRIVVTRNDAAFLEATVGLCDDGQCRIHLKDDPEKRGPLEQWQFRRRALESLFFDCE